MSDRLNDFFKGLRDELTNSEIAAGMCNGNIDAPKWISVSEDTDHIKVIDNESTESFQMGFTTVWYGDTDEDRTL